jgi:chemotaxis protein MotB
MDKFLFLPLLILALLNLNGCVSSGTHKDLQTEHEKTLNQLSQADSRISELETLIAELERKLGAATDNKKSMSESIEHMKSALKEASIRKMEIEKRMDEFRKLISRFKALTDAGELTIKIVDGRMVVALPSDVLFPSGSAKLSAKGNETIKKVTSLLSTIPDRQYQIEGHTDNVPIRSERFPSNWDLASERALNVLKMMISSGLSENRISAASFSDTKPVSKNTTKEGKAANRRIEIVVIPDLSQLPGYEELNDLSKEAESK